MVTSVRFGIFLQLAMETGEILSENVEKPYFACGEALRLASRSPVSREP